MSTIEEAIEIAKKQILEKLAEEEPYIFAEPDGIYHKVKKLENGELVLTLRIHNGFVTDVVETTVKRKVYKKKENTQLTTD